MTSDFSDEQVGSIILQIFKQFHTPADGVEQRNLFYNNIENHKPALVGDIDRGMIFLEKQGFISKHGPNTVILTPSGFDFIKENL